MARAEESSALDEAGEGIELLHWSVDGPREASGGAAAGDAEEQSGDV